jgi:6-phosphogluconate dehydrogenase
MPSNLFIGLILCQVSLFLIRIVFKDAWRQVVSQGVLLGVPLPCFSTALAFYDGYRSRRLPANLIQAQRDYFGAHTYELLSAPGHFVHTNWTGHGGQVSSSTYNA